MNSHENLICVDLDSNSNLIILMREGVATFSGPPKTAFTTEAQRHRVAEQSKSNTNGLLCDSAVNILFLATQ